MKVLVLLFAVLCLALPVQARSGDEPLPPSLVTATWTQDGVEVSWLPPAQDDADHPVLAYWIERVDVEATIPAWARIGTVAANATAFLDSVATPGLDATYRVTAVNHAGPSLPSNPSSAMFLGGGGGESPIGEIQFLFLWAPCPPIILGGPPNFVGIDEDCLPHP